MRPVLFSSLLAPSHRTLAQSKTQGVLASIHHLSNPGEDVANDLDDGSSLMVTVVNCTEWGNQSLPGIQVPCMGNIVNNEPLLVKRLAYQAAKAGATDCLPEADLWLVPDDQFVKNYLVPSSPLKAKVAVETRSSQVVGKEYELPFAV